MGTFAPHKFHIPRQTDTQILTNLIGIAEVTPEANLMMLNASFGRIYKGPPKNALDDKNVGSLLSNDGEFISKFYLQFSNSTQIEVSRDLEKPTDNVLITPTDSSDLHWLLELQSLAQKRLNAVTLSKFTFPLNSEQQQEFFEIRVALINKLDNLVERLVTETHQYRIKLDGEFSTKTLALESTLTEKQNRMEEELRKKAEELENEKKKFATQVEAYDDRDSKHVRRELFNKVNEEIKRRSEAFRLTTDTINLRSPIKTFSLALTIIFGIAAAFYSWAEYMTPDTTFSLIRQLKIAAFTLAFGATAIFYIRWENKWFQQHADEEFRIKKMELDMYRSSWLVETALEWRAETQSDLPQYMIEKLAQDIFIWKDSKEDKLHPADQLASAILGASSTVNLRTAGGTEIALDRRALDKLRNQ